jgi:16S rRNA G527 N7-methylase RsmG
VELTLIESNQRKAVFLREVVRALGLFGVKVFADRAEELSNQANLVILRAVERFEKALPVALKLVGQKGRIALLIGDSQIKTASSTLSGVKWEDPLRIPLSHNRSLLVGSLTS